MPSRNSFASINKTKSFVFGNVFVRDQFLVVAASRGHYLLKIVPSLAKNRKNWGK